MRRPFARNANGYQNAVLTAIALLLTLGLVERGGELTTPSRAQAQPDRGGMTNDLEQRQQIIAELQKINSRLERMESKLASGINVEVTSMPAMKVEEPKPVKPKADEPAAPKTPSK